jgi:hypothetical protein
MEAPEKIYLFENPITETPDERWLTHRSCEEDIEYTRTDAFIEKAEKYLESQFIKDVSVLAAGAVHINFSIAIKNFVNYMKRE